MLGLPFKGAAIALTLTVAAGAALAQSANPNASLAPSGRYRVVRDHTQAIFSIMHLGLSPYFGRIAGATGTLRFNALDVEKSNVAVELDAKSTATLTEFLSRQLCAEDVLNCTKFPKLQFKSTALKKSGANTGEIMGDLTIAGVTRPAVLQAIFHGGVQGPLGQNNYVLGFSAKTTIKRSEFGLTKMLWSSIVGDEVELSIAAEFEQDNS